ncbi:MAG: hypothetical protein RLZZ226_1382 [Pseudomonadota bacterium]|jgi:ubiquinone biosynthesis protein UbiJ
MAATDDVRRGLPALSDHPVLLTLGRNLAEYWQEESRELPAPAELGAFSAEVARLQAATDNLEARILRLQQRFSPPPCH